MRRRMLNPGAETWAGLFFLGLAIVYWFQADALPKSVLGGSVGSAGMPHLLAVGLGVVSCLLVVQSLIASDARRQATREALPSGWQVARALGLWAVGVGFVLLLPWLGYPVTVALLLAVVAAYYGRPPSLSVLAFAVGGAVVFYLLFVRLLSVPMPMGVWLDLLTN